MSWSPTQYSKFEAERNRPILDLLARLSPEGVENAIDIGCGPGNSTELLQAHFPNAQVTGLDSSPEMIEAARERLPNINFDVGDIATWSASGPFDLIFGNAVLQWLPDHATLLPALMNKLAKGGILAIQMPDNLDEPAHRLMRSIATEGEWATKLADAAQARSERHDAAWYYEVLRNCSEAVEVWRTTYFHPLADGPAGLVEWFKGTGLRPFLGPLNENERAGFLTRYKSLLTEAYPPLPDGAVLLPFPRLFFTAKR